MSEKHEIADQPSPAVRKEQECELTETELNRVTGGEGTDDDLPMHGELAGLLMAVGGVSALRRKS